MFFSYPNSIIIRHNRENLKKCTLSGIEDRPDCCFYFYPQCVKSNIPGQKSSLGDLSNYFLLDFEGPVLSKQDGAQGLILLDGTWRYAEKMVQQIPGLLDLPKRSLPSGLKTAYPRRQEDCLLPDRGLASIEALFVAYYLLGRDTTGLLDHYHWKELFLKNNALLIDFK